MLKRNQLWLFGWLVLVFVSSIHTKSTASNPCPGMVYGSHIEKSPIMDDGSFLGEFDQKKILQVCKDIETNMSGNSQVYYPSDLRYHDNIRHYSVSSTTSPVCCVEPASASDLSIVVRHRILEPGSEDEISIYLDEIY